MAYYDNLDEQNQQKSGAGGVIAGSGGAGSQGPTTTGTGFTNLQKYLSANQGSGGAIADNIISQGQNAVSDAQKTADTGAAAWADQGVQNVNDGVSTITGQVDTAIGSLEADRKNRQPAYDAQKLTYGGPKSATEMQGYNDLDKAYQNVKNTATNFAGDLNTQKAGLQKQYGYGSGFGALDTFIGRQDGKDKLQGWANSVNPGSAQSQIDRVNSAIGAGQQSVTDAQGRLKQALTDNVAPLSLPAGTNIPSLPDQLQPGAPKQGGAAPTGVGGYVDRTPGTAVAVKPKNAPTSSGTVGFNDLETEYLKQRQRT
jgi:hypothetical protein